MSWPRPRSSSVSWVNGHMSLSHEVGSLGLIERENATILNGALAGVANEVALAMHEALAAHKLRPVTFFAQNDGTLMAPGSGPALPGADHRQRPGQQRPRRGVPHPDGRLAGDQRRRHVHRRGSAGQRLPRESSYGVEIGGIRTNFRMPDLVTIALGGGTVVTADPAGGRVGPRSVGYRLGQEALVFGGGTATLTDSAVAGRPGQAGRP